MASPNMARYKIIERATKKKIQKMREVTGKPYTDTKNTYILVKAIPIEGLKKKSIDPHLAKVEKYRPYKKNTYFPSVIRCPLCNRRISWSQIWEAYICYKSTKHDTVVFEMVREDVRNARGRVFIYNEQVKTAGPIKEERKRYGYRCRLPHKKNHPQGKICGKHFKTYDDFQKHLRDKHKIRKPKKMGVYRGKERTSDQKVTARVFDYIITSKMTTKPSIIYCPTCNEAAPANTEEGCFKCINGHKWYSEAITEARKYYCPHCTRNIEVRDGRLRCEEKYRCPSIRLLAKEFGARKRRQQEEPDKLTKKHIRLLDWNRIYVSFEDPDVEYHKRKKEKHTHKKKVPDNTEPSTPLFDHYKNKGRIVILEKSKETDIPIKEGKDPLAEIDLAVAKGFGYDKVKDHKRKCPVCKKVTAHLVYDRQMRAADEAPSIFYKCKKCGHTERVD